MNHAPFGLLIALPLLAAPALAGSANLLPNGSFELVEPPPATAQQVAAGQAPPADTWIPRTWGAWGVWGATWRCPDDPAQAHSGQRCLRLLAQQGQAAVRHGPMPVPDQRPWTIKVWARGSGQLTVSVTDATTDAWRDETLSTFDLRPEWTELSAVWTPPALCRKWCLTFLNSGPTDAWLDEASLTCEGATATGLPPRQPLTRDDDTLLLLDFEESLDQDAFYVGGQVKLTTDSQPGYGKALALGAEAYVACSADEHLNATAGTIELWCKLLQPGNDSTYRPFISVPGPEGFWLGKDQYAHVGLAFSTGWSTLASAIALGYAGQWQPCWRHIAACWDASALQVFVDGKLIAWQVRPRLLRVVGPELRLGAPGMVIDNLRLSKVARYRVPLPDS